MTSSPPPLTLYAALVRAFHAATLPDEPYRRLTEEDTQKAADIALRIAEAYIAEARADERQRCAAVLRDQVAVLRTRGEWAAAKTASDLANLIDPQGPLMGAPAAGGIT